MEKKTVTTILVVLIILLAISGIWFLKNENKTNLPAQEEIVASPNFEVGKDFDIEELKQEGLPIILDFGADYCPPCKELKPILQKLSAELEGKALIRYVDTEKYPGIASKYPVSVIPTQVLINADGTPYKVPEKQDGSYMEYLDRKTQEHALTVHVGIWTEEQVRTLLKEMGMNE